MTMMISATFLQKLFAVNCVLLAFLSTVAQAQQSCNECVASEGCVYCVGNSASSEDSSVCSCREFDDDNSYGSCSDLATAKFSSKSDCTFNSQFGEILLAISIIVPIAVCCCCGCFGLLFYTCYRSRRRRSEPAKDGPAYPVGAAASPAYPTGIASTTAEAGTPSAPPPSSNPAYRV